MRKESTFGIQKTTAAVPSGFVATTVKRQVDKVKKELVPLSPTAKMLTALRKVLVKMSNEDKDGSRYFISGDKFKVVKEPAAQALKEGEFGSYQGEGYAKVGVTLRTGDMVYKMLHFTINFRDCLSDVGLPDVEFLDPTNLEELDLHHPEVSGL